MKPVVIGLVLGLVLGFIAACFFLYSLWLPIIAICILLCGIVNRLGFQGSFRPSALTSAASLALYFGIFWGPAEFAAATAESPSEHARAATLLIKRGGHLFGADERAFQHFLLAAEGQHKPSLLIVAEAYLFGHYGQNCDPSKAKPWLEKAQALGSEKAAKLLSDAYHFPTSRPKNLRH